MDKIEQKICELIDTQKEKIISFGRDIWEHPELGYREERTAAKFSEALRVSGITDISEGLAITGVKGVLPCRGISKARIALFGEMDALHIPSHPMADPQTGAAHACGHNAQITAVMGAALALCDEEVHAALDGDLVFMGVPAEESIAGEFVEKMFAAGTISCVSGKSELITNDHLDDVEMVLSHHIGSADQGDISVSYGSANGFVNKTVTFHGIAAHSAGAPYRGVDAMSAASIAMHAVALQRESFREEDYIRIHGYISDGGSASNVIADKITLDYSIRGKTLEAYMRASKKFDRAMRAGAVASGAGMTLRTTPGYLPVIPTMKKESLLKAVEVAAQFTGYHSKVIKEMSHGTGSTDLGDITAIMPLLHFETAGYFGGGHTVDYHPVDEYLAYVVPSIIFSLTAYHLLKDGASEARRVIDSYEPTFTKEQYKRYLESMHQEEHMDLNPIIV